MNRGLTLLIVLVVMALGLAMAQTGTLDQEAAKKTADILCPIVNLLTGTLIRLVIIVLLAAAIATYFLVDARAAKTTAITLAIGTLLVMNFGAIQKLFTGYELDTKDQVPSTGRIDFTNSKIYCK
jgi:heme/copper-type cytochrome/quinol oxidase subunit 2